METYNKKYSKYDQESASMSPLIYPAPENYDNHFDHFSNFFESIRTGKPVVEDPVSGFRAATALPCVQRKLFNQ